MSNKRLYVDFHVIQTVPPSCVNRDDTGRPKTAFYGGVERARVSSQSWKHAIREMFKEIFEDEKLGFRTKPKYVATLIANELIAKGYDEKKATTYAEKAFKAALTPTKKQDQTKKQADKKDVLFFISSVQIKNIANLVLAGTDFEKGVNEYREAIKKSPSIDIALFGRMVAVNPELGFDASCQVAHSISTHSVKTEYDYFTAIDDYSKRDETGAAHLGTMEFNSSTLYRYATVNVMDLFKTIGTDAADAVAGFARAFIFSMPEGKQNSYANKTLPDLIYVTVREDQPVNFSGAFEEPVERYDRETREYHGFVRGSKAKLFKHAKDIYDKYCTQPKYSFVIGNDETNDVLGAEKKNINELLAQLREIIVNEVN